MIPRDLIRASAIAACCTLPLTSHATNGYFLPGFGVQSMSMGGVGIASGMDAVSAAANPANLSRVGHRFDLDITLFNPQRTAHVYDNPASPVVNPFFGTALGPVESGQEAYLMPNIGYSTALNDKIDLGVAFVANGGMNTTYRKNFFNLGTHASAVAPGTDTVLGIDLMQLLIPLTTSFKVNETQTIGASLTGAVQRFEARGLEEFGTFGITSDANSLTNKGKDWSYGAGIRLGWIGDFADKRVSVGATWASKTYMTKFDRYKGLFAEQGDFDIPSNYGLGLSLRPNDHLTVALDVTRTLYSGIKSVSNRGPDKVTIQAFAPGPCPADPQCLGNDDGMGFGWTDQTVYKIGVSYQLNDDLALRAGYNYGKSPIPDDQFTFNTLAPATVEKHYSVGFNYKRKKGPEISGVFMVVPNNRMEGCGFQLIDCASIEMKQRYLGVNIAWDMDKK